MLFRSGFLGTGTALGLLRDATIRIQSSKGSVALLKNSRSFFDEGLDVVDELVFVELLFGLAVGFLDVLGGG